MKYFKRSGVYRASNVSFDPIKIEAYSYNWWKFVSVIEGKVIFNCFRYSNSTSKHQCKVRRLMELLGINIDQFVSLPKSLGTYWTLEELYLAAEEQICNEYLESEIRREERNARARMRYQLRRVF